MAEEVLKIKITADNAEAIAGLNQTETAMQNVSAAFKKQQDVLKGLQTSTVATTAESKKLDITLGELKDNLKDLKIQMDLATDPAKFMALKTEANKVSLAIKEMEVNSAAAGNVLVNTLTNSDTWLRKIAMMTERMAIFGGFSLLVEGIKPLIDGFKQLYTHIDPLNEVQKDYEKTLSGNTQRAAEEVTQLKILEKVATDLSKPYAERISAVNTLQDKYPQYLGNLSQEAILSGQAANAISQITDALYKKAIAEAASSRAADSAKNILDLKKQESDLLKEEAILSDQLSKTKHREVQGGSSMFAVTGTELDSFDLLKGKLSDVKDKIEANRNAQLAFNKDVKFYTDEAANLYDDTYKLNKGDKKEKVYKEATVKEKVSDDTEFKGKFHLALLVETNQHLLEVYKEMAKEKQKELDAQLKIEAATRLGVPVERKLDKKQDGRIEAAQFELMEKRKKEQKDFNETLKQQVNLANSVSNSFGNILNTMAHSKEPFKALTDGLKEFIIQLGIAIVKALIFEAIMAAITGGSSEAMGGASEVMGSGGGGGLGGFFKKLFMPHAEGGVTTGPSYGLIGEAGPEAILPLDRFRGFVDQAAKMGAMTMQGQPQSSGSGEFVLRGNDLVLSMQRSNYSLNLRR